MVVTGKGGIYVKIDLLSFSLSVFFLSLSGFVLLSPLPLPPKSVVTPPIAYVAHNTLTLRLLLR